MEPPDQPPAPTPRQPAAQRLSSPNEWYPLWQDVKNKLARADQSLDDTWYSISLAGSGPIPYMYASGHLLPKGRSTHAPSGVFDVDNVFATKNQNALPDFQRGKRRLGVAPINLEGINVLTYNSIRNFRNNGRVNYKNSPFTTRVGMVPMDFPGPDLIDAVINVNTFQRTVANANDSGPGSLRQALADSTANGVINFSPALNGATIVLTSGKLQPTTVGKLTIDASMLSKGITLSGRNLPTDQPVIHVTSGTVKINSISIVDGPASGVLCTAGTLRLVDCSIYNNSADFGGGINVSGGLFTPFPFPNGQTFPGGSVELYQCTIANNLARNTGGGIYCGEFGVLHIHQSTIVGNQAIQAGGGVGAEPGSHRVSPVYAGRSIIAGNSAPGGEADVSNGPNPPVQNFGSVGFNLIGFGNGGSGFNFSTDIINHQPAQTLSALGDHGGPHHTILPGLSSPAIDASGDDPDVFAAGSVSDARGLPRFTGAHADIGAVEVTTVAEVTVATDTGVGSLREAIKRLPAGGAVRFDSGMSGQTINLASGLRLTRNLTVDASALDRGVTIVGGTNRAVEIGTNVTAQIDSISVIESTVDSSFGAGIYLHPGSSLVLKHCTLARNSAFAGGAIYNFRGTLSLSTCTFADNSASSGGGAAIYNDGGTVDLNLCTFSGNVANTTGGAIHHASGTLNIKDCVVAGNLAFGDRGADIFWDASASLFATGKNLIGNNDTLDFALTAAPPLIGSPGNVVDAKLAPLGDYGGPSPTMPPLPGSPAIDAASFRLTFSPDQRRLPRVAGQTDLGAVEAMPAILNVASVADDEIDQATNHWPSVSAPVPLRQALRFLSPGGTIRFDASLDGQTIRLRQGQILLAKDLTIDASTLPSGLTLAGNSNDDTMFDPSEQRVLEIASGYNVTLTGLTIQNGEAGVGGGILNEGNLVLNGCTIKSTRAVTGGGGIHPAGTLTVNDSVVAGNRASSAGYGEANLAESAGGGVFLSGGTLTLNRSTVADNYAEYYGGGLWSEHGTVALSQSSILHNAASDGGGVSSVNCTFGVTNSTIVGNAASFVGFGSFVPSGGGLRIESGTFTLVNSTVAYNSAGRFGGGIIFRGTNGSFSIGRSIIANNTAIQGNPDVVRDAGTAASFPVIQLGPNLIGSNQGAEADFVADFGLIGSSANRIDALLSPLGFYGSPLATMAPLTGSPALNGGSGPGDFPSVDQRGVARGNPADLGAIDGFVTPSQLSVDLQVVDFGFLAVGDTGTNTFHLRNPGTAPVTVSAIPAPAGVVLNWTPGILQPGESLAVQVAVTPTAPGDFQRTLSVRSDASSGTLELTLTAVAAPLSLEAYQNRVGEILVFTVTGSTNGSVIGSDLYRADSVLAAAAVHAGVLLPGERGEVYVSLLPGVSFYLGLARNGVISAGLFSTSLGSFRLEKVSPSFAVFSVAEVGEMTTPGNLAATGVAFAKDVIAGVASHQIAHLNDGQYGNDQSWIGGTSDSFAGISFGASPVSVASIAFGRDNGGEFQEFTDRSLGRYTLQYTAFPNPDETIAATNWITIKELDYNTLEPAAPHLRHRYNFNAVAATGVRILTPPDAAIDELEVYSEDGLRLRLLPRTAGHDHFEVATKAGQIYEIQRSFDLNSWSAVPFRVPTVDGRLRSAYPSTDSQMISVEIPVPAPTERMFYYRGITR